ncbi:MAG: glutamine--fructose-6-phosphate transaminase (isomerizing) [Proteocatella sp.]|nr:glutamine--fructose-6-phosphate transaminase (isomerizing) [Proteocatella sp.]NCB70287.1 glutamine--fructose-6-phosphate transaminase (isomerizing) [Clostridia bacterium]MBP7913323.1 glutamine--fructose-6-phosphate transaminase (isomerizing) [Proteocatella sp.]MBP8653856.1 glutamine--fructose-6-phosphate transaminase (isomerizing) [Proteocatella sp.]MBP9659040.1 glutamine--fructose-6-phosphate transaminase (isomerizing) [Proteocatella sp.]
MCGIVGYVGSRQAQNVIIEGLEKLEYRGYDSSGIAVIHDRSINTAKFKGRLSVLDNYTKENPITGNVGIGHTRWATHGAPSDINSHPHLNNKETIAVVHNGIIENYLTLKEELQSKGYQFVSETDTEVIAHLVDYYYEGDLLEAVFKTIKKLKGAYALGVIAKDSPEEMIAVRKESPLIVGLSEDGNYIASDVPAILNYTRDVYFLDNGEVVRLTPSGVEVFDFDSNPVDKEVHTVEWSVDAATKGGYDHFMLKEVYEQPQAIRETLTRRIDEDGYIKLDDIKLSAEDLNNINKIYIVACGTAYHAGKIGKLAIEKLAKIPVETDIASEFRYSDPFVDDRTLLILVSQSGETADTLAALREAKRKGARILSITNVVGSSIARESDDVFYTWAGPEVAVASTKAYTTQLIAFYMVALNMAIKKGTITKEKYFEVLDELKTLSGKVESLLEDIEAEKSIAQRIKEKSSLFYLGRGADYQTALEGSLKLKEISYIFTEAFAAGELKHGTIALIEEGTPVVAIATQKDLVEKMISNIKEVKARGAYVYAITTEGETEIKKVADEVIYVPETLDLLKPVLSVIPTQLIAYYTSLAKGIDVDKPRNLAKSVTVE